MSTKTTYKRIALVAVAALGFGLLSVAPSSAISQSDTLTISAPGNATSILNGATTSTTITQSFLGVAGDTMTVTVSLVSSPAGNTAVPTLTAQLGNSVNGLASATGLVGTMADSTTNSATNYVAVTGNWTLAMPALSLAGTYVVRVTPANLTVAPILATVAPAVTWTITVAGSTTAVAPDTTSNFVLDEGTTLGTGSTNAVVVIPVSSGSAVAAIRVVPRANSVATTGSVTMSTVVTGPGTITVGSAGATFGNTAGARALTNTASGGFVVYVYGDGTPGAATITMTIGTNVVTRTVTFFGAAASVTSTLVQPVIAVGSAGFGVGAITAVAKDAAGNAVPGANLWLVSSNPTVIANGTAAVATVGSTGTASFNLVGLTAGSTSITIQNVAAGSTATFSAPALSVRVGSNVGTSLTMTLDKATYEQGAAAILTVMIKDAAGSPVANGSYSPFSIAPSSSKTLSGGSLPGATLLTSGSANGTLTYAINVPSTTGDFTISASAGSGWTGNFSTTATVSVSAADAANAEAIAAAADAAAEATDAANAATDAANAAAEAADAATAAAQDAADAVAALSVQVGELIAGLVAQITAQKAAIRALTNLVIKIQKRIAKILKKLS